MNFWFGFVKWFQNQTLDTLVDMVGMDYNYLRYFFQIKFESNFNSLFYYYSYIVHEYAMGNVGFVGKKRKKKIEVRMLLNRGKGDFKFVPVEFERKGRRMRIQSASVSMRKKACLFSDQCQLHVLEYRPHGIAKVRLHPAKLLGVRKTENVMWHVLARLGRRALLWDCVTRLDERKKHAAWNVKNMVDTWRMIKPLLFCAIGISKIIIKFALRIYNSC